MIGPVSRQDDDGCAGKPDSSGRGDRERVREEISEIPESRPSPDLTVDGATLRQICAGLDGLEREVDQRRVLPGAKRRGYLTPDEERRVRQMWLTYRNYRLAAHELIGRYGGYVSLEPETVRLEGFLVAFGAALTLYARSLRIIELVEHAPLLRMKLNEPEPRCDLEAGSFDQVLASYSSISNYRLLREADRYWRSHRRRIARLGFNERKETVWLTGLVRRQRRLVRNRLLHVLFQRLCLDWRSFWDTVFRPAHRARYGLQATLGETFAQARLSWDYVPGIDDAVLSELAPQLQPGDVLLVRTEKKLTTALLPGFWAHAAIYLGQGHPWGALRKAAAAGADTDGLRSLPEDADEHGMVLEAIAPCVRINSVRRCLEADHVLVLRPQLAQAELQSALIEALAHLGKPYDFEFDFTCSARVVCTGLVYRSFHGRGAIRFELVPRMGRFTLSGDDLVHQALNAFRQAGQSGGLPFHFAALALKRRHGRVEFAPARRIPTLLGRIRRGWRPLRRA